MSYTVILPCDPVEPRHNWAKEYCPSYITNVLGYIDAMYWISEMSLTYYFGEETDAVLFALKWR